MKKAAFVDIDGTITKHGVAHRIGLEAFNDSSGWRKAYATVKALQVKAGIPLLGEDWGLKTFVKTLGKVGITKDDMERYCVQSLEKNLRYEAIPYLKKISEDHDLWLLTVGCDIAPQTLEKEYGLELKGYMANELIYHDDKLVDCDIKFREDNMHKHVEAEGSKYDSFIIIDDRPHRYGKKHSVFSSLNLYAAEDLDI